MQSEVIQLPRLAEYHPAEDPDDEPIVVITTTSGLRQPDGDNLGAEIISFSC